MPDGITETCLPDIPVLCILSPTGIAGSAAAFNLLESKLPDLKRRKFYGVLFGDPDTGIYRACVEVRPGDNGRSLGLDYWTIPGGEYKRLKIRDWENNTAKIGPAFSDISKKFGIDTARPVIEFYRSRRELILFSPLNT